MLKFKKLIFLICSASLFSFIACKSTPEPEPQPAPVEDVVPEEEPVLEEENFVEANKALFSKVEESRNAALAAGADKLYPEAFKLAEIEYAAETMALETSSQDMSIALKDLNNRYLALESYAKAKTKQEKIDTLGFASYNQAEYDSASAILNELSNIEALVSLGSTWYEKSFAADEGFSKVLDTAFRALAKEERLSAFLAKKSADEVKASVSRKAEYDKAVDSFKKGDSKFITKDPEGAYEAYKAAKESFTVLAEEISVARAKAQLAVDAAKQRVAESESKASNADELNPLGDEPVEGIEEADAKLLEEDDFTKAEESIVIIEEILDEDGTTSESVASEDTTETVENIPADETLEEVENLEDDGRVEIK